MVTHDPRAAERARRTLRLANGQILPEGSAREHLHVA
jgi:predicted ABC-type transport system involved in lysophospholipase L1 biosynthesis ATPase subunit